MRELVVVYNPKAGGAYTQAKIKEHFSVTGLQPAKYIPLDSKLHRRLAKHIAAKATIAVVGGDGTMSSLADMIGGTGATLAPLPGGTLNHFASDLGIPQDLNEAIKRLEGAKRHKIDVASVNNVSFVNNSSIGLYPASLQTRSRLEDRFGKWFAAIIGSIRALVRFKVYRLKIDGETLTSPFVFIGNNRYELDNVGDIHRKRLDEGILSVYVARVSSRWRLFGIFLRALTGRLRGADHFDMYTVRRELVIEGTKRNIHVSHDGEVDTLSSRLTYRLHRKDLWVV